MRCIQRRSLILSAFSCILVLGAFGGNVYADTSNLPPNGELKVAYRQMEDGKLSRSIHHLSLICVDGSCRMTTLTLNQCMSHPDVGEVFYPAVQQTSTMEGNLSVIVMSENNIVVKERLAGAEFTYDFKYSVRRKPELSGTVGLKQEKWFDDITGFSGVTVKYSTILDKVISWQCVPLKGRSPIIEAECKIILDGVP